MTCLTKEEMALIEKGPATGRWLGWELSHPALWREHLAPPMGAAPPFWPVFSHLQGQGRLRSGISHKTESEMMTIFTVLSWTVFTVFLVITLSWALFFYSHIRVGRAFRNIYYLWGRRGLTRNSPNSRATFSYPIDQLLPLDLRSLMLWEIAVGLWNDLSQISVGP